MIRVSCSLAYQFDIDKRHEDLILHKKYADSEEYPTYDNYDAINVDKLKYSSWLCWKYWSANYIF